jgi:hypothetical protein
VEITISRIEGVLYARDMKVYVSTIIFSLVLGLATPFISHISLAGRNWSHFIFVYSFMASLIIAFVFAFRSKMAAWVKAILAVVITFGGPFICLLAYALMCMLFNKKGGYW